MNTAGGQAVDHQGGDSQWYLLVFPGVLAEISWSLGNLPATPAVNLFCKETCMKDWAIFSQKDK